MITCNGVVGLALVLGPLRHRVLEFNVEGSGGALAVLTTLVTLSLVLPDVHHVLPRGDVHRGPARVRRVASLVLYGVFVFVQTVRHRDYFLPPVPAKAESGPSGIPGPGGEQLDDLDEHAPAPGTRTALTSLGLLFLCLVAVVGLAKTVSKTLEDAVKARCAAQRRRGRDRPACADAGDGGGGAGGASQPAADQPQPRPRVGDGEHRADDSCDRGGVDLVVRAAGAGTRGQGDGAAGAHRRGRAS